MKKTGVKEFNNILSTDIASGTMANIFRIQGVANLSEYIDNGLILDVQPYLDEDPEWGGGRYILPLTQDN